MEERAVNQRGLTTLRSSTRAGSELYWLCGLLLLSLPYKNHFEPGTPLIPMLARLEAKDLEFDVSLGNSAETLSQNKQIHKIHAQFLTSVL